jgi:hypothetical protein
LSCVDLYCKKCRSSMHVSCNLSGKSDQELLTGAVMKCYRCKRVITIMKLTEGKVATEADSAGRLFR